jgi:dGTPase
MGRSPGLEAQIADAADEIAYHNHDIDDGLRSGLLALDDLQAVRLWREAVERVAAEGARERRILRARAIVALIDRLVTDLIETTRGRLESEGVGSPEEVRGSAERCVAFSPEVGEGKRELARFLLERLYSHHRVLTVSIKAERVLSELWEAYTSEERLLPAHVLERVAEEPRESVIADYIAGMTDRFAMEEHRRLFDPHAPV